MAERDPIDGAVEGFVGLVTNPLVLIVLVLLAVFGGRELLRRRAPG